MRIVIVEDHQMFREVIHKMCVNDFGHQVVGEAGDGATALRVILGEQPDLLLLDLQLPDMDGFTIIETVRKILPKLRIIAITSAQGDYTLYRVERAEIDGFVDKNANSLESLRGAIEMVGRGKRYLAPSFLQAKAKRLANPGSFDKVLSERERVVLGLIGQSCSDDEIAKRLKITAKTSATFRQRIMRKLDMHSTPKLMRFAIENGFTQVTAPRDGGPAFS
ncbi:MAG: response regulator transcription factor [Cephaloticoccus sp.]|nr:response regulator transcription factor [Cephaloticoccus sp.]MCF7759813.1 response regulator transcription factor [Cephaloticoccus sp.]